MADDPPQSPERSLVDGTHRGTGGRLRVGGDNMEAGRHAGMRSERFHETECAENAQLIALIGGSAVVDIERPAVDDAVQVVRVVEFCDQLAHLPGLSGAMFGRVNAVSAPT
jgi:hypothetical protein